MTTQIVQLPEEVNVLALQVSENKREEVKSVLNQIFIGTDEWETQVDAIEVKGVDDKMSISLAEVARKNAKNARLNAESIFDAKRSEVQTLKAEFDTEDKLWLKAKQIMQIKFKAIEEKAKWKSEFVKRFEAEQKETITQNRILQVEKYAEINRIEFENMSDESFNTFLSGIKSNYEAKIKAEKEAEEKRISDAKIEADRIETQRLENERLKLEAEKREKEIEVERKKQADILAKQKAESDRLAKIESDKQAKIQAEKDLQLKKEREEKEKLEAELKTKKESEIKAENERLENENKAKLEAQKLSKAPVKKQLNLWVESFKIELPNSELLNNEKAILIKNKFDAFKKWAKSEIDNI